MDYIKWTIFIFAFMRLAAALEEESQKPSKLTGEQKLLKKLFNRYNKLVRPQGSPLNVSHFIELRRIVGLYSFNYVVGLDIWDNQEWTDDRLVWNPIAYSNVTLLHVPSDVIWTPDIVVVNSADEYPRASQPTSNVIINADGSIVYYQSKLIYAYGCRTAANVECNVKFYSWTYNGFELNLINTMDEVATNYEFEGSFSSRKFLSGNVTRNVHRYACCPEPYVSLTYKLKLNL